MVDRNQPLRLASVSDRLRYAAANDEGRGLTWTMTAEFAVELAFALEGMNRIAAQVDHDREAMKAYRGERFGWFLIGFFTYGAAFSIMLQIVRWM